MLMISFRYQRRRPHASRVTSARSELGVRAGNGSTAGGVPSRRSAKEGPYKPGGTPMPGYGKITLDGRARTRPRGRCGPAVQGPALLDDSYRCRGSAPSGCRLGQTRRARADSSSQSASSPWHHQDLVWRERLHEPDVRLTSTIEPTNPQAPSATDLPRTADPGCWSARRAEGGPSHRHECASASVVFSPPESVAGVLNETRPMRPKSRAGRGGPGRGVHRLGADVREHRLAVGCPRAPARSSRATRRARGGIVPASAVVTSARILSRLVLRRRSDP